MGRRRKFTDNRLKVAMKRYNGDVEKVATKFGCSVPPVYWHARRLGLSTIPKSGIPRISRKVTEDDYQMLTDFKLLKNIHALSESYGLSVMTMRQRLMNATSRVWGSQKYPTYPRPNTPSELRIFYGLKKLQGRKNKDGLKRIEDPLEVIESMSDIPEQKVQQYHTRFMDHRLKHRIRDKKEERVLEFTEKPNKHERKTHKKKKKKKT